MANFKIGDVLDYIQPTKYIVLSSIYSNKYDIPVLTPGDSFILGYTNEKIGVYKASKNNPVILFDDFTTSIKWVDFPFKVKSSACKILVPRKNCNMRYMYYLMKYINFDHSQHKRYWISEYSKIEIKQKQYEIQEHIVEVLDHINNLINSKYYEINYLDQLIKSRFIEMFGDIIENPKGWPTDSLKNITDVRDGTHDSPKYVQDGYPFITSKNITNGDIDFSNVQYISKEDYQHIEVRSHVDDGDILMPMIGTVGGAIIVKKDRDFAIKNVCLIKFKNSEKVTNVFIKYVLNSEQMMSHLENIKKGGNQPFVSLGTLRSLNVVLPPLDIQKEFEKFVQQIDKSKFIVQQQIKELQELLDSKMDEYFR